MKCKNPTIRLCRRLSTVSLFFLAAGLGNAQQPPLEVQNFTFRQFEGGPAWPPGYGAASSEVIFFDFRIAGFGREPGEFDDTVRLSYTVSAIDSKGRTLAPTVKGQVETTITEEDKKGDWKPKVTGSFTLPAYLPEGTASARVSVQDAVAKREISSEVPFPIHGLRIEEGAPLSIVNFRFLRSEDGQDPLEVAAYAPGDMVWARFEMIGFAVSSEGDVAVSYGIEVSNTVGRVMYKQEIAAEERRRFSFPPAYLPGLISLALQDSPKGAYTIRLTVTDGRTSRESVTEHAFRIE